MTGRARLQLIALLLACACAPSVHPVTAPEPVTETAPTPVVPAAMEQVNNIGTAPARSTEPAPIPAPALESAGVVVASTDAVAAPVAPAEASWDIEVKEYLTHDRVDF